MSMLQVWSWWAISQLSIKTESRGKQLATLATKATAGDAAEGLDRHKIYCHCAPWSWSRGSMITYIVGHFSCMHQNGLSFWFPGNNSKSLWQVTLCSGFWLGGVKVQSN